VGGVRSEGTGKERLIIFLRVRVCDAWIGEMTECARKKWIDGKEGKEK